MIPTPQPWGDAEGSTTKSVTGIDTQLYAMHIQSRALKRKNERNGKYVKREYVKREL